MWRATVVFMYSHSMAVLCMGGWQSFVWEGGRIGVPTFAEVGDVLSHFIEALREFPCDSRQITATLPRQITATLPDKSLPPSHTNHCHPPTQITASLPAKSLCQPASQPGPRTAEGQQVVAQLPVQERHGCLAVPASLRRHLHLFKFAATTFPLRVHSWQ